jgi:uncharacterized membrane protein YjjP (DUF1212 family)
MSDNKKKFLSISCVITAVLFLIGFAFVASYFPINQTYSTFILGAVAFLVFGVLYKVICEIWR